MIKKITKKRIACVGDGGNDVAMIQEAHVGLGIEGKEGMQASLAADFSVRQFKDLRNLILWHGRLSYKRTAALSQFVIHRGMIISFIQAIFQVIYFYVTIPIYNGMLILGYSTFFTAAPTFALVLDDGVSQEDVYKYPRLYRSLQKGRALNTQSFLQWIWKSIFQVSAITFFNTYFVFKAFVIMYCTIRFFDNSFLNIVTITFTTLILLESLNVLSEVQRIKKLMILSVIVTLIIYMSSIWLMPRLMDVSYIDGPFFANVIILTAVCWLPFHILKMVMTWLNPSEEDKILAQSPFFPCFAKLFRCCKKKSEE